MSKIKQFTDKHLISILVAIAVIYITIISYFSYLRFTDFFTSNWDLGIGMQSLWTNTHGYLLYESGDYEGYGVLSFLQVHSTYVAILFSYLYAIYSSPLTLFVLQAVFVTFSIIPLYYLAKKAGLSSSSIIFIVLLYILNFSIISGLLYDFHWESLIPAEFFSLFLLVLEKKYYLSLVIFAIGCMTLEIFPFILVGIVFYFFITKYLGENKNTSLWSEVPNKILLVFLSLAIVAYFIIRVAQYYIIPVIVHQSPFLAGLAESSNSLLSLHISLGNISLSLLYWLMIIISLGMLPLLAPKLLLTAAPWIFYTFMVTTGFTTGFGNQDSLLTTPYAILASIGGLEYLSKNEKNSFPKILGLLLFFSALIFLLPVYGKSLSYDILSVKVPGFYYSLIPVALIITGLIIWYRRPGVKSKNIIRYTALFACSLIAMNLVLSPVNTENFQATPLPGYSFSYSMNPEFQYATEIAKLIPKNATVVASDNLFPLVANSRNAYSLAWMPYSNGIIKYLPFNESNLPDYIFIDQSSFYLPEFLNMASTNYTKYGLYAYTYSKDFPGSIALYRLNYKLAPVFIGVQVPKMQIFNDSNLDIGSGGSVVKCNSAESGKAIFGKTSDNQNLTIWYGPYTTISPGNYSLTVSFKIIENITSDYHGRVLELSGWVYHGITIFNRNITFSPNMNGTWQSVKVKFSVDTLILNAQFSGILYSNSRNTLSIYLNNMILVAS